MSDSVINSSTYNYHSLATAQAEVAIVQTLGNNCICNCFQHIRSIFTAYGD